MYEKAQIRCGRDVFHGVILKMVVMGTRTLS